MKYGFIGCGNMGGAIAAALSRVTGDILLSDRSGKGKALAEALSCRYGTPETAAECSRVFLAVKPQNMAEVLLPLRPVLAEKKPLLISMAAGLTIDRLQALAGTELPILRIMPSTSVSVGRGIVLYCRNELVSDEVLADVLGDMRFCGTLDEIEERLFDGAGALTGCGPAYLYLFLEAMADGAVACGVPRAKALRYAAETMAGAAETALSSGKHPAVLRDAVCSPGGSTIAGVRALEQASFRSGVMEALIAACERNKALGK